MFIFQDGQGQRFFQFLFKGVPDGIFKKQPHLKRLFSFSHSALA
jgi:hypothetical protein